MLSSSLLAAVLLPLLVSSSSLRPAGACGGDYGPCGQGSYCYYGSCKTDPGQCLGICVPFSSGSPPPGQDQQQQYQPQTGGFQFSNQQGQQQQGYASQGYQPSQQQQQAPQQSSTALNCVNGFNAQCPQGTVCLADPRNPAITPVAICVPATKPCGGPSDTVCPSGLFCMADPRVNCFPNRGDRGCSGLCV